MNIFGFGTVLKTPNIPVIAGIFFLWFDFIFGASCHTSGTKIKDKGKNKQVSEPKIAKTVPSIYIHAADNKFSNHQDTVYYNGHFYTGYRFEIYPDGDTAALQSYFNGVEEGFQRRWYPGRKLNEERFFINGKKEGMHMGWWPDGKPKFIFSASDNEYEGEFKEWNNTGVLIKQFHYHNGQEEGSQRLWWNDGSVRANYVIKKGKKYGLIGLKLCNNPYDSVNKN